MNKDSILQELLSAALAAPSDRQKAALQILRGETPVELNSSKDPLLLSMSQAARMAGISRSSLWKCVRAKKIKPVEIIPGFRRIRLVDIQKLAGLNP